MSSARRGAGFVPRRVDHAERRAQITDATRQVVLREGLDGVTFQAVAGEAGVSVRLVQYYFGNKEGLLVATHRAVLDASAARFSGTESESAPTASPGDLLRGIVAALLPLDAQRHADAVVLTAFHAAALTRTGIDPEALLPAPSLLVDVIAAQLDRANSSEAAAPTPRNGQDTARDAELVLASVSGLTQSVVAGRLAPQEALAVAERLLAHLIDDRASSRRSPSRRA
jgi:TetR/AcrR family transcriptional repressor of bet genes